MLAPWPCLELILPPDFYRDAEPAFAYGPVFPADWFLMGVTLPEPLLPPLNVFLPSPGLGLAFAILELLAWRELTRMRLGGGFNKSPFIEST